MLFQKLNGLQVPGKSKLLAIALDTDGWLFLLDELLWGLVFAWVGLLAIYIFLLLIFLFKLYLNCIIFLLCYMMEISLIPWFFSRTATNDRVKLLLTCCVQKKLLVPTWLIKLILRLQLKLIRLPIRWLVRFNFLNFFKTFPLVIDLNQLVNSFESLSSWECLVFDLLLRGAEEFAIRIVSQHSIQFALAGHDCLFKRR